MSSQDEWSERHNSYMERQEWITGN